MRTLTLGVLIASGGTLAALPFRRYQANLNASNQPVQVTGPTHSALDNSATQQAELALAAAPTQVVESEPAADKEAVTPAELPMGIEDPNAASKPNAITASARTGRGSVPLTYEDLVQPVDLPAVLEERFNATTAARVAQDVRERAAELVMPAMESLAVTQQEELRRVAEAAATLASSPIGRPDAVEDLPKPQAVDQRRHWIRQPQ